MQKSQTLLRVGDLRRLKQTHRERDSRRLLLTSGDAEFRSRDVSSPNITLSELFQRDVSLELSGGQGLREFDPCSVPPGTIPTGNEPGT